MTIRSKAAIVREVKSLGYKVGGLLSVGSDAKTVKGAKKGYMTGILYMMPTDQLCPMSIEAGCREACLVTAGRAAIMPGIGEARAERTRLFTENRSIFLEWLCAEIDSLKRKADKNGMIPVVRLNGTSDIDWNNVVVDGQTMFERYSDIQFYDYSKRPNVLRNAAGVPNYHVTASYSEVSDKYRDLITAAAGKYGANLAVVFDSKRMPEFWNGKRVINGDETDLRFLDETGVVVGLSAKGKAKKDTSGFVIAVSN